MVKQTPIILCTLSTSFLFAAAPPADRSVQQPAEQQSPLRRAFVNRDISLLAAARAARQAAISNAPVHADEIGTTQAAPGHAARFEAMRGHASIASGGLFTPMAQKTWTEHDQITVIVLENARVERTQELKTKKNSKLAAEVAAWTDFFNAGNLFTANPGTNLPRIEAAGVKDFKGDGDYGSEEQITFRTTATVLEVLPNGNLVLQARHTTQTDDETTIKTITGMCDPRHIAPDDTLLHWRLYDLDLNIQNNGFVKNAADKGFIAQLFDMVFAF